MAKKIDIIGGGITGLCAGCYLQMNGYDTEIFEMHILPGGLCTSWERKGYTFDGCLHWLVGSNPSDTYYHLWNELIDMQSLTFIYHQEYMRIEDKDGQFITENDRPDEPITLEEYEDAFEQIHFLYKLYERGGYACDLAKISAELGVCMDFTEYFNLQHLPIRQANNDATVTLFHFMQVYCEEQRTALLKYRRKASF
ncbi:MAG: NAD(P)/FAD-dependent oxidoreductase [Acidobacteria bacterium]|nr:NAD(P)/FAD-dependent oxidoreductase [Acidobacteriota bacterium]